MPMGTRHDETGSLQLDNGQYLLRRDGGGTWQLEFDFLTGWRARRFIGHRVRITGTRVGFDVLSAERMPLLAS